MQGFNVEKENSQNTLDQSVIRMSDVKMVLFDVKSFSNYSSSGDTSA